MASNNIELTDEQKNQLLKLWEEDVLDVKILTEAVFPGRDGRSKEGVAVKTFLASKGLKPRVTSDYQSKAIELNETQKQFVEAQAGTHKPIEITRLLFNNRNLTNLDAEGRAVLDYYNTLDPKMRFLQAEEEGGSALNEYRAPRNLREAITKINRYVFEVIDESKLTQSRRDQISFLVKFMNTHRFVYTMNRLGSDSERVLFESSFVRFVHDKPDLTEEDIDLYVNLCGDIISQNRMAEEEKTLRNLLLEENEDGSGQNKMAMSAVEYLSQLRKDMGSNLGRQKQTLQDLTSKRSSRIQAKIQENASVLNLVEAWKDKEKRDRLIKQQLMKKELLKKEVDRLSTMDGVMFEIFGVGHEEALA